MKKYTTLCFLILFTRSVNAQINLTLSVNARPIANLSMWSTRADMLTLVATLPGAATSTVTYKINTTIKDANGSTIATTNLQAAATKRITGGTTSILYAIDVLDLTALVFEKNTQLKLNQSGQLPSGSYQVTVQCIGINQPIPISNTVARFFTIAPIVLPILIKPYSDEVLQKEIAQTAIIFRWSPVAPAPANVVVYRLAVFEVLLNQTPNQAVRANMPLLDKDVIATTQYLWQPQLSFADSTVKKYVWTIQTLGDNRQPLISDALGSQGISEPKTFSVSTIKQIIEANKNQ